MPLLLSTADTDLLAARAAEALLPDELRPLLIANPMTTDADAVAALVAGLRPGADYVLVRLLGGRGAWQQGFDSLRLACAQAGVPLVALGGESALDAELTALSTAASGVVTQAAAYLAEGGPANLVSLLLFLSDTLLLTGHGFDAPATTPLYGIHGDRAHDPARPTVGVVFYRAHELSGNTGFVDVLCDALEAKGGNALPVFVPSLRPDADGRLPAAEELLAGRVDALVVTVLASGGANAGDTETWDAGALAALDVPLVQGLCLTSSRAQWADSDAAISPLDAAMQVAIPEFDGRLISVPFSFKEPGPDGVPVYVADPERASRVAGIATRLAALRRKTNAEKKIALVLSSYP
ncbi:MAG: cobaltochelatase CobN, partial [Frankiales bacterium]|nr:cobaltochelatase CobN [Frankiales bacterium]